MMERARTHPKDREAEGGKGLKPSDPMFAGYPESVQRLLSALTHLPGIGPRSAERLAFFVLTSPLEFASTLSSALVDVKKRVGHCSVCFNLVDRAREHGPGNVGLCDVCASPQRDRATVMVVEQPKDVIGFERTGAFHGVYHVLMGRLSPLDGVTPDDLTIADLLRRIVDPSRNAGGVAVREVILALNPTMESDGTLLYLVDQFEQLRQKRPVGKGGGATRGLQVTRLARGVPTGTQLELASKAVLADALQQRRTLLEHV